MIAKSNVRYIKLWENDEIDVLYQLTICRKCAVQPSWNVSGKTTFHRKCERPSANSHPQLPRVLASLASQTFVSLRLAGKTKWWPLGARSKPQNSPKKILYQIFLLTKIFFYLCPGSFSTTRLLILCVFE